MRSFLAYWSWGTIPIVRLAKEEQIINLPPELDGPWTYVKGQYGVTSQGRGATSNYTTTMDTSSRSAKRQRPASPHCEPNPCHANTLQNEGKQGGRENIDRSGLDELEDHDILKPQKLTPPLGGRAALSGNNGQLRHSPSVISEDGEYDGPERISDDRNSGDLSVSNEGSSHL
ncbi:hypothetical protein LIPSTDRAFT_61581 [Lipomyces starkeyi NRRL Y-11557]|uniref:Uncharacterized protein n=1 Tax=Lipomyces starkeyi NRRL Y-11557 TaxID=675824 RepID=A0A1E3QAL6_LIPST|nr:hypothetical protein LIPSTDRAFT_61581 [Lipomyces starkeyi NRRL Y-11557]